MRPFLDDAFGNPSSKHWAGAPAKEAIEAARVEVASLLGAAPEEIVFTSGGSEATNLALKGAFFASAKRKHIVATAVEHPATLNTCRFLEKAGASLTIVPVDRAGRVDPAELSRALRDDTLLVS